MGIGFCGCCKNFFKIRWKDRALTGARLFCYNKYMALWSTKRKFLYGGSFIVLIGLIFLAVAYGFLYRTPACTDGKQNGDETGIDCGGSCKLLCTSDALTPVVLWSKVFNISGDVYTAVAYVQNPNSTSRNPKAEYQFKIYDASNRLITVKDGVTTIPKNKKFAVFEVGLVLKGAKPKSADFAFTSLASWEKDTTKEPDLSINYGTLIATSTSPRIEGTITNNSLVNVTPALELDAFVQDENQNVIGASRTFIDPLARSSGQDFVFTWPTPFLVPANIVTVTYRAL